MIYSFNSFSLFLIGLLLFFFFSCETTKLTDGQYLLEKNVFNFKGKSHFKVELHDYVRQKPNSKIFFFFPFKLWMYNLSNKKFHKSFEEYDLILPSKRSIDKLDSIFEKNNLKYQKNKSYWLQRQFYKFGSKPVIIDSSLIKESEKRIIKFYKKKGYYDTKVTSQVKVISQKKAKVIYNIENGKPTKIKTYNYSIPYKDLLFIYKKHKKNKYIKPKDILDEFKLQKEIIRLENLFKNYGFYGINSTTREIYFEADSLDNPKLIPLKLIINKDISIDSMNHFQKYFFGRVNIHDYPRSENILYNQPIKIQKFKNYFIYTKKNKYSLRTITDLVTIDSGSLYRLDNEINTKRRIYNSNNFDISDFKYTIKDSFLNLDIHLKPKLKYNLDISSDLQYSQISNFVFSPGINLKIRNLFRGGENLNIGLQGNFGTMKLSLNSRNNLFNASDISLHTKITYPRLLFPYDNFFISKKYFSTSDFIFALSRQHNIGLGRFNIIAELNYYLHPNEKVKHRINLFNTQYVNTKQVYNFFISSSNVHLIKNQVFNDYFKYFPEYKILYDKFLLSDEKIENQIFNSGYWRDLYERYPSLGRLFINTLNRKKINTNSSLNNSIIYEFEYNQKIDFLKKNPLYLNLKIEYSGLLLNVIDSIFNLKGKIFDIYYSQFLKFDLDIRKYFNLNSKHQIAFRQFFGITIPLKNSFIPFDKNYFMGGSNDIRAWTPFSLSSVVNSFNDDFQFDNMKFFISTEYRFPILGNLYSSFFIDAGNIWNTYNQEDSLEDNKKFIFQFNNFFNQIAIGSGFGLRYYFEYLILRFDLAYKIIDPQFLSKNHFKISKIDVFSPTFNLAINLPF